MSGCSDAVFARQVRDEKAVLVVVACSAEVGLAEDLHADRLSGASEHASQEPHAD